MTASKPIVPAFDPLFDRVKKVRGCWLYQGFVNAEGYGRVTIRRGKKVKTHYAHRLAWERTHGSIPAGSQVHHLCKRRACCNPKHLELVTYARHGELHRSDSGGFGA